MALLALAWTLPFLQWHHKPPIPSFYTEWLAFVLGLLALLPLLHRRYWQPVILPRSLLILLGLIGILVLQIVLDRVVYPQQSLVGALYLLWAVFMLWLGHVLGRELSLARIATTLAWALLAGALISCGIGLLQHFGISTVLDALVNRKVSGAVIANLGQPNHLANYLALGMASLLYLFASSKIAPWLSVLFGSVLLLVLALSGSRASWLYLGAFLVLAWFWRRHSREAAASRIYWGAVACLVAFALAQWLAHLPFMQGVSGAVTPAERLFDVANGLQIRWSLLREALQMLAQQPWLGIGFGQYAWQHFLLDTAAALQPSEHLQPSILSGAVFNHSHNILTQVGAEFGLAGLILLLWGGLTWLRPCLKQAATLPGWWVGAVLAVLLLHSQLEYPLWYSSYLGIAAVLIGATDSQHLRLQLSTAMRAAFGLMLLLSGLAASGLLQAYAQLEGLLRTGQVKMGAQEINRVLQQVRKESLLTPYSDFVYALSINLNQADIEDKVAFNAQVMRFAPTRELVYQQAILLGLQGDQAAALVMLKRALLAFPEGAEHFLQVLASVDAESRERLAFLRDRAQVFLQERMQDAIHSK